VLRAQSEVEQELPGSPGFTETILDADHLDRPAQLAPRRQNRQHAMAQTAGLDKVARQVTRSKDENGKREKRFSPSPIPTFASGVTGTDRYWCFEFA